MATAAFKRTLKWRPGDVFAVPLTDGSFGFVQAVAPVMAHAIDFAVLSTRSSAPTATVSEVDASSGIAVHAAWRQAITGGYWGKVLCTNLLISPSQCPNQKLIEHSNGIGTQHSSIGLVETYLSACHGLIPWNIHKAHSFDDYLVQGVSRPSSAYLLSPAELAIYQQAASGHHVA
jgi:Immunity protein 26